MTRFLDERGVDYTIRVHTVRAFTCEVAARERGLRQSQIVKCLVGTDPEGRVYAMMLPGNRLLKLKKVRKATQGRRVRLMEPNDVESRLGLTIGAISPTQLVGIAMT